MAATASEPTEPPVTVALRDVTADDLPIFFAHRLDPIACQLVGFPARDRATFDAQWARNLADARNTHRTIVADGRVAGSIVAYTQDDLREVGYWLGREFWGRGIATRALAAFLRVETARPLHAHVPTHNVGSRRVLEKCGFVACGEGPGVPGADGATVSELLLRLDADR